MLHAAHLRCGDRFPALRPALTSFASAQLITTVSVAYWADKRNARMLPFVGAVIPSIIGFILLLAFSASGNNKEHKAPLLVGIILSQTFVSSISLLYSWSASNIAGSSKRSVVNGMMLCAFGLGNICGSQAFQASTAPRYYPGASSSSRAPAAEPRALDSAPGRPS